MPIRGREVVLGIVALAAGLAIAVLDSRPGWDDTGITAVLLAVAAGLVAAASGRRPWLWAILVGIWVPVVEIPATGGTGPILALAFAGIGALAGYGFARLLEHPATG
jgi:hypothetical protein